LKYTDLKALQLNQVIFFPVIHSNIARELNVSMQLWTIRPKFVGRI